MSDANHLILCCPVLLLPSVFPSIRVFSNRSALCIRWPKYWRFSNSPSNDYSELMSFRIDCFDLLSVQGALEGLLHHHSSKVPMLQCSAYGPTLTSIHDYWKNHSFDCVNRCWQSDVSAFVMLFRFLVGFLPRNSHRLLSWLQSLSTVILEPEKIKSVTDSNTLATWCKEMTHWKTRWCWERLKAGGEGNDRGWDVLTDSMHVSLSKFQEMVMYREAWCATVHGATKSRTWLSDWTATKGCKRS